MKEGLRSGSLAAQLERGNGPSSRVIVRRRGNETINNGGLESEEKGLNSNDQRCPLLISSDLEANGESKETAIVPLPKESVKVECECEEVGKASEPGRRGRKRGRKSKSECGEGGIGDCKKVKESLECTVEVVGRVLRSKTVAMQAIQMEKNGSGKEVDLEQSESDMVGQRDSGSAHYDKKRVKIEEDESDGGSRKKLKGKQGRPVHVERKRGRPRKDQGKNVVLERVLDEKEEASGSEIVKRKRGRPPKVLGKNVVLERVKNKKASGSKRNTRASKLEGIVQRNGPNSHIGTESSRFSLTEKSKSHELGIQEHETSSGVRGKGVGAFGFRKGKRGGRKAKHKKGKSKDGRAAEKKLVREQIIDMLMRAGWTIDYRPRRDKEYNDAVYTSPTGRGYWSVTLAYNVLKSHYEDGHCEPGFTFTPIPDGVLTKLKRNASKGKKRRLKLEQEYDSGGEMKCCIVKKKSGKNKHAGGKSSNRKMKGRSSLSGQDNLTGTLHKGILTSVRNRKLQRTQNTKRFALLARHSKEGLTTDTDGYVPYSGKRTLLSWMVDLGTVPLNAKVQYMNRRKTRALLEGWISRDGIRCGCCSEILTISKFEIHAGTKLCEPSQNIILETGISLLQCQLDSWNKQEESERSGFHLVDVGADDPNDDTCGICGDGGDLICCDGCPSTFHQSCLDIQKFPSGDWHCIYCSCKFCGMFSGNTDQMNYNLDVNDSALLTCQLCEEKYHHMCTQGEDSILDDSSSPSFCGKTCRELFEQLQMLLGVKHELEDGFSWTLVQRTEVGFDISLNGIPQKVECNSKLAVALSIMDECFLPIVDQRSGINLIHNVLYNCGSNFNRLNYSGFFTAILERGEEIISAASIRIHGNKLAEMPFIGTRHIYRRQGMCRRLLNAIESALHSLNVEKLVIPAISELMQTWTSVFGFKPLEVSSRKEMRNMNMLVFHGTDMLQKPLLKDQSTEESMIPSAVLESNELKKDLDIKHGVANNSDKTCSPGSDLNISSKGANLSLAICNGPAAVESGSQLNEGSLNDSSDITSETTNFPESATNEKSLVHDNLEGKNRTVICPQPSACDAHAVNAHSATEGIDKHQTAVDDSIILAPAERTVESDSKLNQQRTCDMEKKPLGVSCLGSEATGCEKEVFHACKEGKETVGFELKNDIIKQSNNSLDDNINPQHLDVDFSHGSGENTACLNFGARSQMSDDAKDGKHSDFQQLQVIGYTLEADDNVLNTLKAEDGVAVVGPKPSAPGGACPTSTQCCSEILCQRCTSSNEAVSHLMPPSTPQKVRDVANDPCAALLVGCDLGSSCQGDGLDSHKLEYVAASVNTNCQPSDAATGPNEHLQPMELASGLDRNDVPESDACAFTCPVGMSHQTPKDSHKASETGLCSHDDGFPPDRPQTVIESDSVADHSSSGSGMALLCASGGCKAGGAPEVMVVSNQAS